MKKLMMSAVLFLAISGVALAQENGKRREKATPEQRAERMTAALDKSLSLSASQRTKIYGINLDRAKKAKQWDKKQAGTRTSGKDAFNSSEKQLLAVLTPDQKKAYQQLRTDRRAKHEQRKGKHHPAKEKPAKQS